MNQIIEILVSLSLKFLLLLGFIALINFWIKKSNNYLPIIVYWILGLFFVLILSFQILQWVGSVSFQKNPDSVDGSMINSISSVLSLSLYIYIGVQYLKRKKKL